jgi:hypothetical protein
MRTGRIGCSIYENRFIEAESAMFKVMDFRRGDHLHLFETDFYTKKQERTDEQRRKFSLRSPVQNKNVTRLPDLKKWSLPQNRHFAECV